MRKPQGRQAEQYPVTTWSPRRQVSQRGVETGAGSPCSCRPSPVIPLLPSALLQPSPGAFLQGRHTCSQERMEKPRRTAPCPLALATAALSSERPPLPPAQVVRLYQSPLSQDGLQFSAQALPCHPDQADSGEASRTEGRPQAQPALSSSFSRLKGLEERDSLPPAIPVRPEQSLRMEVTGGWAQSSPPHHLRPL